MNIGSLILPILVLIVVELSSIAREVDLKKAVNNDHPPLLLPNSTGAIIPNLGRFNFIHGFNTTLILFGVFSLSHPRVDLPFISSLILFVLWAALPMLEVDEYDDLLEASVPIRSVHWHIVSGAIAIPYIAIFQRYLGDIVYLGVEWSQPIFASVFLTASTALVIKLETELETYVQ